LLHWRRRSLWQVLLQQGLKQQDDEERECEHQQEPAVQPGFLLRIFELCQSYSSMTANSGRATTSRSAGIAGHLHRIISSTRKRMTAQQTPRCHHASPRDAVMRDGIHGVFRAGRHIAARRRKHGRDRPFVSPQRAKRKFLPNAHVSQHCQRAGRRACFSANF